jgi:hypothetical protein
MITSPIEVSKAATENKIKAMYDPRKSSRKIEPKIKFVFMPNKIISKANKINSRLGLVRKIKNANNRNKKYKK